MMQDFYTKRPPRYRAIACAVLLGWVIAAIVLSLPLLFIVVPTAYAVGIITASIRYPESWWAIQRDDDAVACADSHNDFVEVLEQSGIIDENTTPETLSITCESPCHYVIEITQAGKTQEQIEKACASSLHKFNAAVCEVEKIDNVMYSIAYETEAAAERLARMSVEYNAPDDVDIEHLPIGIFKDGEPVYISLESRHVLLAGVPRSGKSCTAAAILCDLMRIDPRHEKIFIFTPKTLDFQRFGSAAEIVGTVPEMMEKLSEIREEMERRKRYCAAHEIKKVDPLRYGEVPHITVLIDEYTVIRHYVETDEKGKPQKLGEQFEREVMKLIAECGAFALSFVISLQRAHSANIDTNVREIMQGTKIHMQSDSPTSTAFVLGEYAAEAPAHEITTEQKGIGYISIDGGHPRIFKGALTTDADEAESAAERVLKEIQNATHLNR